MTPTKKTKLENKDYCKKYREKDIKRYRDTDNNRKQLKYFDLKMNDPEGYKAKCEAEAL